MPTTEEALEWVKQNAPEEIAQALDTTAIREENKRLAGEVRELRPKAEKYDQSERRPQIETALKEAKVDVSALRKSDWEVLTAKFKEGELDPEAISQHVTEYELPTSTETPQQQRPAAAVIAEQATGGGVPTSSGDKDAAFYADLDSVPDGDKAAVQDVLIKHGRAPAQT